MADTQIRHILSTMLTFKVIDESKLKSSILSQNTSAQDEDLFSNGLPSDSLLDTESSKSELVFQETIERFQRESTFCATQSNDTPLQISERT